MTLFKSEFIRSDTSGLIEHGTSQAGLGVGIIATNRNLLWGLDSRLTSLNGIPPAIKGLPD